MVEIEGKGKGRLIEKDLVRDLWKSLKSEHVDLQDVSVCTCQGEDQQTGSKDMVPMPGVGRLHPAGLGGGCGGGDGESSRDLE